MPIPPPEVLKYSSGMPALLSVNGISMEPKVPEHLILGHSASCSREEEEKKFIKSH